MAAEISDRVREIADARGYFGYGTAQWGQICVLQLASSRETDSFLALIRVADGQLIPRGVH